MVKAADTPCPGNKGAMRCASVRFGAGGEDMEAEAEVGGDLPFLFGFSQIYRLWPC